ncbi:MAG: hypothetical protein IJU76_07140 [Desulfovibrionaceae bacterium]|nr:hypothetical protein [Desulfovibrionaceae bacterium]
MASGLVQNTDFSSDLLLNKVMNGQYSATSGKTITLAGRINASQLDTQATKYAVQAENVREGAVYADAVANALSEFADIAKRAGQINASMSGEALKEAATGLKAELAELVKTKADNGTDLFGASGPTVDLGQGAGTITLGQNSANGGISALSSALSTLAEGSNITATGSGNTLEVAQTKLLGEISDASAKAALLENRYTSLNDLISSYKNASDDQVVNAGGNSTSLLNNLLS